MGTGSQEARWTEALAWSQSHLHCVSLPQISAEELSVACICSYHCDCGSFNGTLAFVLSKKEGGVGYEPWYLSHGPEEVGKGLSVQMRKRSCLNPAPAGFQGFQDAPGSL